MIIPRLVFANFRFHRVRLVLTLLAIALSVSLVVAVSSGIESIQYAGIRFLDRMLGGIDAQIMPASDTRVSFDENLIEMVRRDPAIQSVVGRLESQTGLVDRHGRMLPMAPTQLVGVVPGQDEHLKNLAVSEGKWFTESTGNLAVLDQVVAERLGLKVGDTFKIPGVGRELELQITGIIYKPDFLARQLMTIYVPLETLQAYLYPKGPQLISKILVRLRTDESVDAFVARIEPMLQANKPMMRVARASDYREEMKTNLQSIRILGYLGSIIALLSSGFIIFSALAMGVAERQRVMAMLRAIGGYRGQLVRLVVFEAVLISVVGAFFGVLLGLLWVKLLSMLPAFAAIFIDGMVTAWSGVALGVGGAIFTAVLASLIPAWQAAHISPLEAMTPLARVGSGRLPIWSTLAGLLLICIDPLLLWGPFDRAAHLFGMPIDVTRQLKFYGHFVLGLPGVMIGYFLLAPLFVWLVEKLLVPVVAPMLGLRIALLRQQLTGSIWRAAGTCAALMVGLAILVTLQTEGHSIVKGWQIPTRFPDMFIASVSLGGLNESQQKQLMSVDGFATDAEGKPDVMPISISTPRLGSGLFSIAGAAVMPDATMFFGVDPNKVFDMMDLDFRDGNAIDAKQMLLQGGYVLVTDEYRQIKGLGVGDVLPIETPEGNIDFKIAGVVWSPGIDVVVNRFDLSRQFEQRTAASVFGTLDDARKYFDVRGINFFAANLRIGIERDVLVNRVKSELGTMGLFAGDVRHIKAMIDSTLMKLLMLVSTVSLAALAVASLGVTNTIMASVRSRRWQFGILRSVGASAGQLMRMIVAEAILLGLVGVALGLAAGLQMAFSAHAMTRTVAGYSPPIIIPWWILAFGGLLVLLVSLLASLGPAFQAMRTTPLKLLQAGRASS